MQRYHAGSCTSAVNNSAISGIQTRDASRADPSSLPPNFSQNSRALRTINIREESEKLNIWVAYFNLENEYGNPPEEAVSKIFQRALQYCDPKKVHLALLGMYERTEQKKLAEELLDKMTRKFKHSCKVA